MIYYNVIKSYRFQNYKIVSYKINVYVSRSTLVSYMIKFIC